MKNQPAQEPKLLIVSDDAEFSRALIARCESEQGFPPLTLMRGDLCQKFDSSEFELAIIGRLRKQAISTVLLALNPAVKPVLLVCDSTEEVDQIRSAYPRVLALREYDGWLDAIVLLAAEVLRRNRAVARAHKAEQANAALDRQATLGRYMLEMRHSLNNALTSVLGNSELLLLEPGSLRATARSQVDTIRNMALRMHEVLQRFSSLEKELSVAEKQSENEKRSQAAAGGL